MRARPKTSQLKTVKLISTSFLLIILSYQSLSWSFAEEPPAENTEEGEASEEPVEEINPYEAYETLITADLERQWPDLNVLSLTEGEKTFIAIQEPDRSGKAHGAILLLHDLGGNLNDEQVIRPLREAMPEYGWETLSIQLPYVKLDDGKKGYLPMLDQINTRIASGLAQLKQSQPTHLLIIAYGLGAAMALHHIDTTAGADVNGLIAISLPAATTLKADPEPEIPEASAPAEGEDEEAAADAAKEPAAEEESTETAPTPEEPLPEGKDLITLLTERQIPILDLYGETDFRGVHLAAKQRQNVMRTLKTNPYTQTMLPGADHSYQGYEQSLIRKIRGWLNKTYQLSR